MYALLDRLRERHPAVERESCAADGVRIDLAMLSRIHLVLRPAQAVEYRHRRGLLWMAPLSRTTKQHAESVRGSRSRQRNPLESVMTADVWPPSCA